MIQDLVGKLKDKFAVIVLLAHDLIGQSIFQVYAARFRSPIMTYIKLASRIRRQIEHDPPLFVCVVSHASYITDEVSYRAPSTGSPAGLTILT